jgi:hypothetical protein
MLAFTSRCVGFAATLLAYGYAAVLLRDETGATRHELFAAGTLAANVAFAAAAALLSSPASFAVRVAVSAAAHQFGEAVFSEHRHAAEVALFAVFGLAYWFPLSGGHGDDHVEFRPYEAEVRAIYANHDAARLHHVDSLLDKYAGRERDLLLLLKKKYLSGGGGGGGGGSRSGKAAAAPSGDGYGGSPGYAGADYGAASPTYDDYGAPRREAPRGQSAAGAEDQYRQIMAERIRQRTSGGAQQSSYAAPSE